jgi:PAS domain S-box-containing protein
MTQRPSERGQKELKAVDTPHGGLLLLFLIPVILLAGGFGIGWISYALPSTQLVLYTPYVIGGSVLFLGLFIWLMLLAVMPAYLRYAKNADKAMDRAFIGDARYVRALFGSGLGFWEYDAERGEVFFSAQMMIMLGYGDKEVTQKIDFWYENIHPDDVEGVERTMKYHLEGRTPDYAIEYRLRKQNGEYLWVSDHGMAIPDRRNAKPTRISGITEDVSNVKRVQEVLESRTNELEGAKNKIEEEVQNVRKFQKAVDSSTEAVSITTPDGAIIYVNQAWMKLNGYTDAEALGRNPRMLKSTESNADIYVAMWEKIAAGYSFHTDDMINKRKDGTTYHAELSIFPIREGEQNLFYVSLCSDITLRKEIDRAKTEFVSLASHQLRTPLSAIRWYSEMLLSKYVGHLNEKQRQYVKEIYEGNLRMVDLVNALLNVSRIDLGTFAIEPEPISLVEICDSVLAELRPQIEQKGQTVDRLYTRAPEKYPADPKLIRIVFQNFLSNSVKYTQEKGHIVAEIGTRDGSLYIRVSDNGYGIPKPQQGKIFEKLFRADNVRQKDTEGTGLGMYIVKAIVESSGGKIWFESEENKGTTFHVMLPIGGMPKKGGTKGLA